MITARALLQIVYLLLLHYPLVVDLLQLRLGQLFGNLCFQRFNRIFLVFQVMLDALPVDLSSAFLGPGQRSRALLFLEGSPLIRDAGIGYKLVGETIIGT